MIGRWYEAYVDGIAGDRGPVAFLKWLAIGVGLQFVAVFLGVPIVMLSLLAPAPMRQSVSAWLFLLCFFAARVVICVIPAARAAAYKGREPAWLWGAGAFAFGQLVLAAVAAVPPAHARSA